MVVDIKNPYEGTKTIRKILDPLFRLIMLRIQLRTLSKISTAYLLSQVMQ